MADTEGMEGSQRSLGTPAMQRQYRTVDFAPGKGGSLTVSCPAGTVVTSGGAVAAAGGIVYRSRKSGNGWQASSWNDSGETYTMIVHANCLTNTNGAITEVSDARFISAGQTGVVSASCPAGSLLSGGGYNQGSLRGLTVFASLPNPTRWEVHAKNLGSQSELLTTYALCLTGVDGYTLLANANMTLSPQEDDWDDVACSSNGLAVGGGAYTYETVNWYGSYMDWGGAKWIGKGKNTSTTTGYEFRTYVQCLHLD
jgi:hypothetical protein